MTQVGRRPTLYELLEALHAIELVEADAAALDPEAETFRVVLTFRRAQCPADWVKGLPKPAWLIEQIMEELHAWSTQRNREEQWVSKEESLGSSIDTLMAHYAEELKRNAAAVPQHLGSRIKTRILTDTVLRLKELKERRAAGKVYSQTESRRERARKSWEEEEFEAPKREEAQQRAHSKANAEWADYVNAEFNSAFRGADWAYYTNRPKQPPPSKANNKQPWHEILGVPAHASKSDIKLAHRKLVAKHQPRTSADAEDKARNAKMAEINTARDEGLGGL